MMGELCLGALKLQGMQSFWAADGMCSSGAEDGLLRKTRIIHIFSVLPCTWSLEHAWISLSLSTRTLMCPSKHTAQNPFFLCILMSSIHSYLPFLLLIFLSFFSPLKTPEENVYQDSSRKCSKLHPHFELSAKAPKIPANGEPRMQFWEHEALLQRSCESHAPRVLREGAAINSPLIVAAL
ncbi:hypothetical protein CK203_104063 [Vitis vinifera]|uniref:Uncharacterized protein n=1 Tax=Vitis vinifera TaxID=29760 RepID=A0A438F0M5_VITVI|nr:hypothetical protein CK203_104063 [Vitis vinifera]